MADVSSEAHDNENIESDTLMRSVMIPSRQQKFALSIMKAVRSSPHGYRIIFPDDFFEKDLQQLNTWREQFRLPRSEDEVTREKVVDAFWAAEQSGGFIPHLGLKQAFVLGKPFDLIPAFRKKERMVVDPTWARSATEANIRTTRSPKWDNHSCAFDAVLALINRMNLRVLNFDQLPPNSQAPGTNAASTPSDKTEVNHAFEKLEFAIQTWCLSHIEHHVDKDTLHIQNVMMKIRDAFRISALKIYNYEKKPQQPLEPGMDCEPAHTVDLATRNVPQVMLHTVRATICRVCNVIQPQGKLEANTFNYLELGDAATVVHDAMDIPNRPVGGETPTFLQSLQAFFARHRIHSAPPICSNCNPNTSTCVDVYAVCGALPPRLVLSWPKVNGGGITEPRELKDWNNIRIPHWVVTDREDDRGFSVHQVIEHYRVAGIIFTTGSHFMTVWRDTVDQWAYYDGNDTSEGNAQRMNTIQVQNIDRGAKEARGTAVVVLENVALFNHGNDGNDGGDD